MKQTIKLYLSKNIYINPLKAEICYKNKCEKINIRELAEVLDALYNYLEEKSEELSEEEEEIEELEEEEI
jgi:transglutaminase/protease-like cytokinesis protein 3